jgi:hypothetical protein
MYSTLLIVGAFLAGAGLVALAWQVHDVRRRLHALEVRDASKHDVKHIVRADVGEAILFDYAKVRTELERLRAQLETATLHAQYVAAGGSPDDPASKWAHGGSTLERG